MRIKNYPKARQGKANNGVCRGWAKEVRSGWAEEVIEVGARWKEPETDIGAEVEFDQMSSKNITKLQNHARKV